MIDIITCVLAAIFFIFIGYRPPWWHHSSKNNNNNNNKLQEFKIKEIHDIPGPVSLPFLGTGWLFLIGRYKISKIPEYYKEICRKYGEIIKEEALFNVPIINVFNRKDIEKVFRSTGKCPIRPPTEAVAKYRNETPERYSSTGLVNEQGAKWQFLRTSLTSAITSPKTINDFLPELNEIADDWCYLIRKNRDSTGNIKNLEDFAGRLGLELICALVLGRRMGFLIDDNDNDHQPYCGEVAQKLGKSVHDHFLACRDTYFGIPWWKIYPTKAYKQLCKSEAEMYELATELIKSADDSVKSSAVFQSVIHAEIDEKEKKSAIVDFLAAGIYTLSNSLLFLLYQLAMHEECQRKILQDDTKKSYTKACSTETFRLTPTIHALARITETDLELSGYHVPSGTVIICQTSYACQDEANFPEPLAFKPERWLDEHKLETNARSTFILSPFGYGKRICPGKRFIEHALPLILEKMVQNFHIQVEKKKPLELVFEFLVSLKGPITMNFQDR